MPQPAISRSSTSATVVPHPPTNNHPSCDENTPTTDPTSDYFFKYFFRFPSPVPRTVAEREAKNQEARERIFGPPGLSDQGGPMTKTPPPRLVPNVIRNTVGPDTNTSDHDSNAPQGFSGKRDRRPPKP